MGTRVDPLSSVFLAVRCSHVISRAVSVAEVLYLYLLHLDQWLSSLPGASVFPPSSTGYIQKMAWLQRRELSHRKDLNLETIP